MAVGTGIRRGSLCNLASLYNLSNFVLRMRNSQDRDEDSGHYTNLSFISNVLEVLVGAEKNNIGQFPVKMKDTK